MEMAIKMITWAILSAPLVFTVFVWKRVVAKKVFWSLVHFVCAYLFVFLSLIPFEYARRQVLRYESIECAQRHFEGNPCSVLLLRILDIYGDWDLVVWVLTAPVLSGLLALKMCMSFSSVNTRLAR